jgi:hypothetical protein
MKLEALSQDEKRQLMVQLLAEEKQKKERIKNDRKAFKELSVDFVTRNIHTLVNHQNDTEDIIKGLFSDFKEIQELKTQVYGERDQDSHTSTLPDGSASITIGHNVSIKFDGTENAGVEKIMSYIKSLKTDDENTIKLAKMVTVYLKPNPKTQMLNPSKIIELNKLRDEFNSTQFDDGLDIIFNAQIRTKTSMYVSGWKYIKLEDGRSKKLEFRFAV